ncbi:hypothetical protein Osc2_24480 [Ruminococcus sp. 25CYCFAH16]
MTDIWETKDINPMLIGAEGEPFDSEEYIYELYDENKKRRNASACFQRVKRG